MSTDLDLAAALRYVRASLGRALSDLAQAEQRAGRTDDILPLLERAADEIFNAGEGLRDECNRRERGD